MPLQTYNPGGLEPYQGPFAPYQGSGDLGGSYLAPGGVVNPYEALPFSLDEKHRGDQLASLQATRLTNRNLRVRSLLDELNQPGLGSNFEAQGVDQAAEALRLGQKNAARQLRLRGLTESGAVPTVNRGLERGYAGNVANAVLGGQAAEQDRRNGLYAALLGIGNEDLAQMEQLGNSYLSQFEGQQLRDLQRLQDKYYESVGTGVGALKLASVVAGGAAGAAGGAASGAGAGAGAVAGATAANSALSGGGGGMGNVLQGYTSELSADRSRPASVSQGQQQPGSSYNQYATDYARSLSQQGSSDFIRNIFGGTGE